MGRRSRSLVILLVVVLAGCLGPALGADEPSEVTEDRSRAGIGPAGEAALDGGSEPDVDTANRPSGPPRNPWGSDPIVVAVDGPPGRDVVPLVRAATAFWEANATEYAGYAVDYEVRPDATNPDVVVRFRDEIEGCAGSNHTAGCAPYITRAAQIDRPITIEIRTGLSDASTVRVVEHEFGHTLGLGHDEAPQAVMRTGVNLTTLPRPNATERAFPWADSEFTVYVDVSAAPDPDAARRQVNAALAYYERGAPGMPSNVTFRTVDDPDAEIVVRYASIAACTEGQGSCSATRGPDPDGDGVSERYAQFTVTVVGVETDAVGWHTGYWLTTAFGADEDGEKPPPFRDASYEDRRSEWWTSGRVQ